jgi:signal transduction histidine kinase
VTATAVFAAYTAAFALTAVACFASLWWTGRVEDADTRRGLAALLATSGLWAAAAVGYLLAPTDAAANAFHILGLVAGFSTPGAWLYFCSAYTGRRLHRDPRYRRAAVAVFAVVVAVKVTNPLHHAYFTTTAASTPFPHAAVQSAALHWLVAGFAYALSAVGYFMLLELFDQTSLDTRPLVGLASLTALPVALTVAGARVPWLVDMSYEPLGVAAFAVGSLFLFTGTFESVRVTSQLDDPVVFVDADGRIRDYNDEAGRLFPALEGATGRPVADVLPDVVAAVEADEAVLERDVDGERRSLLVAANQFAVGRSRVGQLLLFSDVTESERHRRELERQNERLEQFASVVSHDIRNPLNVAQGRLALAREARDDENLETVADALDRMEALVADLLALARQGEAIGDTEPCSLRDVAEEAWAGVDTGDATLDVAGDRTLAADRTRLVQLFENLFRNAVEHGSTGNRTESQSGDAVEHGATSPDSQARQDAVEHGGSSVTVSVAPTDDGFAVGDDGPGIPVDQRARILEPGVTTTEDGTGFGLAIVASIASAHGWTATVGESEVGGARFEFAGVETLAQND